MAFSDHFSSASFLGVPFCRLDSRFTIGGLNGSIVLIPNAGGEVSSPAADGVNLPSVASMKGV